MPGNHQYIPRMSEGEDKLKSSHLWWLHMNNKSRSNHSNAVELEEKIKAMLKLVDQDSGSFSQRAEIYYIKRPKLIEMVQEFYRMHRSLAESFDQLVKYEYGSHLLSTWLCPLSFTKNRLKKSLSLQESVFYSFSNGCKFVELDEPEVDDPEEEVVVEEEDTSDSRKEEWMKLREELERLREEIKAQAQREELMQKVEEKRGVIRQLSLAMNSMMEENLNLEKCLC